MFTAWNVAAPPSGSAAMCGIQRGRKSIVNSTASGATAGTALAPSFSCASASPTTPSAAVASWADLRNASGSVQSRNRKAISSQKATRAH